VPTLALSELAKDGLHVARAVSHFMTLDRRAFSAGTFLLGAKRLLIFNDGNDGGRQASDVAHELAHLILGHTAGAALDENGCRQYDRAQEAEAEWLGPALLISEDAALHIARQGWSIAETAQRYNVTEDVARFRLNVTAAYRRVA
jgi:Zn-dependent peptidase ImmA (M78 family)